MAHAKYSNDDWEQQFRQGKWDYLLDAAHIPAQSIVAGYCDHFAQDGAILEVGCGNGALAKTLKLSRYAKYLGLDISKAAIEAASAYSDKRSQFVCADAAAYAPDEQYDVIAINECLNYFDDPISLLQRYETFLKPTGVFVVSMYDNLKATAIWKLVEPRCTIEDAVFLFRPSSKAWHRIAVLRWRGSNDGC